MREAKKNPGSGFTLIELLVVIAVIGILAAILIPSALHAIKTAKKAESLLELKQIGGGFHLYLLDNEHNFPPGWGGGQGTYAQHINPYVHGRDNREADNIFSGPFAKRIDILRNGSGEVYSFPISYSANPLICRNINVNSQKIGIDQLTRHSDVILLVDGCQVPSNNFQANATFFAADNWGLWGAPPADLDDLIDVGPDDDVDAGNGHIRYPKGTACSLFVDGSARKIRKDEMMARHVYSTP